MDHRVENVSQVGTVHDLVHSKVDLLANKLFDLTLSSKYLRNQLLIVSLHWFLLGSVNFNWLINELSKLV